jgi:rubredoxin
VRDRIPIERRFLILHAHRCGPPWKRINGEWVCGQCGEREGGPYTGLLRTPAELTLELPEKTMPYKITRNCPHCGDKYSYQSDQEPAHACRDLKDRAAARAEKKK